MRNVWTVLFVLHLFPVLGGEAPEFKRIVFEAKISLGDEAPGVATDGKWVAFAAGSEVHLYDAMTGEKIAAHKLTLPAHQGEITSQVLGIVEGKVYGYLFVYNEERLNPEGQ